MAIRKFKNKGFTLVEMLVTITIFSLIVGVASGVFVSALKFQRKTLARQEVLNEVSYLIEYMSRALRMAKKDIDGNCIEAGLNYKIGESEIEFMNYNGDCQKFYLQNNTLKEEKNGVISELTSTHLKISKFNINFSGETQTDDLQPRGTFYLEVEGKEGSKLNIQTTISQRNLDVRY